MSVTSRADPIKQTIAAGPADQYVKLRFGGQDQFPTDAGRTLVVVWVSADENPHKVAAEKYRADLIAAVRGGADWMRLVEESLKFLLRPPLVKFRAVRPNNGDPQNSTERHVVHAPFVSDMGLVYVAEFGVDQDGDLVSVEFARDPTRSVDLNFREIKIVTIVPKIEYR